MNRNEFLKVLRKHLSFLNKEELEKEMLYYINEIDKSKKSDEEVIKSFGSIDDIVKKVCKSHGIDYKNVVKDYRFGGLFNFYDNLLTIGNIFKKGDSKKRLNIVTDLFILIVITCVLKIPFIFIRDLGDSLIGILWNNNLTILAIWGLIIEIIYVLLALYFFVKTLNKWANNIKETDK